MGHLRSFYGFLVEVHTRFSEDAGTFLAATISFYALFSIFPLLLLAISAAGYIFADPQNVDLLLGYASAAFPEFSDSVKTNVNSIAANRRSTGLVGLLALLWTGTAVFDAIGYAMNKAWKVPAGRNIVLSKLLGMAGVIAIILVLLLTTFLSVGYQTFQDYWVNTFKTTPPLAALSVGGSLATVAISFFALVIIYTVIPNLRLRLRDVWPGAVFATLAGGVAHTGFAMYASRAARFNAVYGSVGVIIGLMFWLYITGVILIFGAEINAALKRRTDGKVQNE